MTGLVRFFSNVFILIILVQSLNCNFAQTGVRAKGKINDKEFYSQFLRLCDSAVVRVTNEKSTEPFFVDSYGVRSLCAAYDMTGNSKYLDACRSWSKRMVEFQSKMIPLGAYYMNYGRKPGDTSGDWYAADCSSIAMGVLATAVRCKSPEREELINSVEQFESLVLKNYVRHPGGISDGLWPAYDGAWWCSSSLFASLSFLLYENTGDKTYLNAGLNIIDWLDTLDLTTVQPLPLEHQGPSLPMYVMEAYSAGWKFISNNGAVKKAAAAQVDWCLNWIAEQQKIPIDKREWELTKWWGSKYGGLPFHQFIFSHYLKSEKTKAATADFELKQLTNSVIKMNLEKSQLAMFLLMSYAESLDHGSVYRRIEKKN